MLQESKMHEIVNELQKYNTYRYIKQHYKKMSGQMREEWKKKGYTLIYKVVQIWPGLICV